MRDSRVWKPRNGVSHWANRPLRTRTRMGATQRINNNSYLHVDPGSLQIVPPETRTVILSSYNFNQEKYSTPGEFLKKTMSQFQRNHAKQQNSKSFENQGRASIAKIKVFSGFYLNTRNRKVTIIIIIIIIIDNLENVFPSRHCVKNFAFSQQ